MRLKRSPPSPVCGFESQAPLSECALLTSSHLLARILDLAGDAILSIDESQRIVLFNQCAQEIFGYSAAEVGGQLLAVLLPCWPAESQQHRSDDAAGAIAPRRMGKPCEIRGRRKNGTEFPSEVSISQVPVDGRTVFMLILRDITERVVNQEQLRDSLSEKEELLQEIHHQVKTQLQVVSSLLGMQSRGVPDPETRRVFQESQDRIHSMALLHESLYESHSLSKVDFPGYVRQLAAHLFHSYGVPADRIRLRTDLGSQSLRLDAALPCGLIVNELVSNSLKYAFPDGREGEIRIELREHSDGTFRLMVADNGVGLKADLDWINARSLGLKLVRTLAERLGAKIEVDSSAGVEVRLAFTAAA